MILLEMVFTVNHFCHVYIVTHHLPQYVSLSPGSQQNILVTFISSENRSVRECIDLSKHLKNTSKYPRKYYIQICRQDRSAKLLFRKSTGRILLLVVECHHL